MSRGVHVLVLQHIWGEPAQLVVAYEGRNGITGYSSPINQNPAWGNEEAFWCAPEALQGFKEAFHNHALALKGHEQEAPC